MTKTEVIQRLCILASKVGTRQFNNIVASDCFCGDRVGQGAAFQFSEAVIEFIETTVDSALPPAAKLRRYSVQQRFATPPCWIVCDAKALENDDDLDTFVVASFLASLPEAGKEAYNLCDRLNRAPLEVVSRMPKLNTDDFAKICVVVDHFREHLGRDEAINTINAIIAKRWLDEQDKCIKEELL